MLYTIHHHRNHLSEFFTVNFPKINEQLLNSFHYKVLSHNQKLTAIFYQISINVWHSSMLQRSTAHTGYQHKMCFSDSLH